ncbi:hypothetical protein D3C83_241520 [compost metagenome]
MNKSWNHIPSTHSTRQMSSSFFSTCIRSLRSLFEVAEDGLKRLMICEIGKRSGARDAS